MSADVRDDAATVPENKNAPCNICGRGWPYHEEACAYACHLRERDEALARLEAAAARTEELEKARTTILRWCDEDAGSRSGYIAIADLHAALAGGDAETP